jgi:hypothetical protein
MCREPRSLPPSSDVGPSSRPISPKQRVLAGVLIGISPKQRVLAGVLIGTEGRPVPAGTGSIGPLIRVSDLTQTGHGSSRGGWQSGETHQERLGVVR